VLQQSSEADPVADSVEKQRAEIEGLRRRVRELEDTVHYLAQTLAQHDVISQTEADVARRMYDRVSRSER
jgi:hypothetical protein